jgi:hypothetical protein
MTMDDVLDWIGQQLLVAEQAPRAALAPHRPNGSTRHWSRRWPRRPLVVVVALVGASGSVGGLALAGTFNGGTISPQAWANGQRVTPEPQMTPEQTADLAILRRPRVASDAVPPAEAQPLIDSPGLGGEGVNLALARRVLGFGSGAAWVIPGNDGTICLIAANAQAFITFSEPHTANSPPTRVAGAIGTAACRTAAVINRSGWWAAYGGTADTPGMLFTAGIVPDGVTSVTVNLVGGAKIPLPVHNNVFMGEIHALVSSVAGKGTGSPLSVTYDGPNGPTTIGG